MKSNRKIQHIQLKKRVLILCEGETEQRYLSNYRTLPLNRDRLRSVVIDIYKPQNHSPLGLVREAKKAMNASRKDKLAYDQVWVVFDKDGHENIPAAFEEARNSKPPINIAFSAICFEYWILLHFEKSNRPYEKCANLIKLLSETYCPNYHKMQLDTSIYERLGLAIENSDWLLEQNKNDLDRGTREYDLNCHTTFHNLMKYLITII